LIFDRYFSNEMLCSKTNVIAELGESHPSVKLVSHLYVKVWTW
jgi:hypothetical protein